MIPRPRILFLGKVSFRGNKHKQDLKKEESSSSLKTGVTNDTELTHDTLSGECSVSVQGFKPKAVSFDVDEYNDIREKVNVYPGCCNADERKQLFWSMDDMADRSASRKAMIKDDSEGHARFVASVEKLFQIPTGKRRNAELSTSMSSEEAIEALALSEYRGYEQKYCRAIPACRKQALRQVVTAHCINDGKTTHEIAAKLSQRQVNFALLVAKGDARIASEYLAATSM